jgi:hypothetical protein
MLVSIPFITKVFQFVISTSQKYRIDESHGLLHSMNTLYYANAIFEDEVKYKPNIQSYERIIYVSAAIHDMCDKKYMNEDEGISAIDRFLDGKMTNKELDITKQIISTMSYSTVKKNGFPDLREYQPAYHIVREADLLTAYDFERCMIYKMMKEHDSVNIKDAYIDAKKLFMNRVLQYEDDGLFFTNYAKKESARLHNDALYHILRWKKIVDCDI